MVEDERTQIESLDFVDQLKGSFVNKQPNRESRQQNNNDNSPSLNNKPLGMWLQEADLVSEAQINLALSNQQEYNDLRLGEILTLRGWMDSQTVIFFVKQWPTLIKNHPQNRYPLGYYLKLAGLLNEQQVKIILNEQTIAKRKFGEIAVIKGWIKEKTLDFFLNYLNRDTQEIRLKKTVETFPKTEKLIIIDQTEIINKSQEYTQQQVVDHEIKLPEVEVSPYSIDMD